MALYEFKCECAADGCDHTFDVRLPMADRDQLQRCPQCGCEVATRVVVPSKAPMVVMTSPQEVMGGHTKERMLP